MIYKFVWTHGPEHTVYTTTAVNVLRTLHEKNGYRYGSLSELGNCVPSHQLGTAVWMGLRPIFNSEDKLECVLLEIGTNKVGA